MRKVSIIGMGMNADTVTQEGFQAIQNADALIGAQRMLDAFATLNKPCYAEYLPGSVLGVITGSGHQNFAVLVSGDTGFYSAADGLAAILAEYDVTIIPGVSSLSYFFARIKQPWQDAKLLSCHGRDANLTDAVRRNRLTFALTGGNGNALAAQLDNAGFGNLTVHAGENLGLPSERILALRVSELENTKIGALAVLLVENPVFDARVRFGIPDYEFIRGDVPMTKSEVRAVTLSRLSLKPTDICCDIGAGTGSVTVEMALAGYEGHVYAIDKDEGSIELIKQNYRAFHIGNVSPICGIAPDALADLPKLNAAFIGGSGGSTNDIISALLRNNPDIRIVANAVALESVTAAIDAFNQNGLAPEIVQISCTRAKAVGTLHMMTAQNPVFIVSGGGI